MSKATETMRRCCVGDVMRTEVITIQADDTMTHAAELLNEHSISGVPVVNEQGQCVGVLSSTDFVHREVSGGVVTPSALHLLSDYVHEALVPPEAIAKNEVSAHMSTNLRTVEQSMPVMNAARQMCDEKVHRLLVVDADRKPVGIVSALDLVACMVVAFEA